MTDRAQVPVRRVGGLEASIIGRDPAQRAQAGEPWKGGRGSVGAAAFIAQHLDRGCRRW